MNRVHPLFYPVYKTSLVANTTSYVTHSSSFTGCKFPLPPYIPVGTLESDQSDTAITTKVTSYHTPNMEKVSPKARNMDVTGRYRHLSKRSRSKRRNVKVGNKSLCNKNNNRINNRSVLTYKSSTPYDESSDEEYIIKPTYPKRHELHKALVKSLSASKVDCENDGDYEDSDDDATNWVIKPAYTKPQLMDVTVTDGTEVMMEVARYESDMDCQNTDSDDSDDTEWIIKPTFVSKSKMSGEELKMEVAMGDMYKELKTEDLPGTETYTEPGDDSVWIIKPAFNKGQYKQYKDCGVFGVSDDKVNDTAVLGSQRTEHQPASFSKNKPSVWNKFCNLFKMKKSNKVHVVKV